MSSPDVPPNPDNPPRKRRRSRRRPAPEGTVTIIDRLLLRPRLMSLDGEETLLPTIDVIVLQLLRKELEGSHRARRALLKYQEFAKRGNKRSLEIRFADSDYTRKSRPSGGEDG